MSTREGRWTPRRRMLTLLAVALGTLVVFVSGSSAASSARQRSHSKRPITIGMSASLTGAYSVDGTSAYRGVVYAVAYANAHGGWLGRKLKLIAIDDRSDPTVAAEAYTKLITQDHVNFIIGPYSPVLGGAVAGIAARYHKVMLDPQTATPLGNRWAIQDEPSASTAFAGLPSLAKRQGYTKVAILEINNSYGSECANGLKKAAQRAGMSVVYDSSYQIAGPFDSAALSIRQAGAQVVADCGFFPDGVSIVRALNNVGYKPDILAASVAPSEPTFVSSLGKLSTRVVGAAPWWPSLKTPGNKRFFNGFKKHFGFKPEYHPAVNFASVQCLGHAVKKANSLNNNKVLKVLYKSTFKTVIGPCKIRDRGGSGIGVAFKYRLWQIQDFGHRKLIWPLKLAQAKIQVPYGG